MAPGEPNQSSSLRPGNAPPSETGPSFFHQLQHLAAIAPGLTEVELRVLIELAQRANPPEFAGRVSQRALALSTGCGRESVKRAIAGLERKKLITTRPGATTRDDGTPFRCSFLHTAAFASGLTMSPLTGPTMSPVEEFSTAVDSPSGLTMSPLTTENQQLTLAPELLRARVGSIESITPDIDREQKISTAQTPEGRQIEILDHVLNARPRDFSEQQHARARSAIMGHVVKFPARLGDYNQPPDKIITAQLLAIAEWHILEDLFLQLRIDRAEAGERYAWFVTVALERIHDIRPETVKAKREELKLVKQLPRKLAAMKGMP
jgi:hypothetical protein